MHKYLKYLAGQPIMAATVRGIGLFGLGSLSYTVYELVKADFKLDIITDIIVILALFILIFPKSVMLPSGSRWRPSVSLIICSSFIFPFHVSVFITFIGLFIYTIQTKNSMANLLISLGHLALGILVVRILTTTFSPIIGYTLPKAFSRVFAGLFGHFLINRFISAIIVSYRRRTKLIEQIRLIVTDLNWGYASVHIIGVCMALMYYSYGVWGVLLAAFLLYTVYRSVWYFQRAKELEAISLTDALTGAENRMSWNHFKMEFPYTKDQGTLSIVDLDHFKEINDQWGHDTGDRILCETVICLQGITRRDHRVFRYGGNEFILFISHIEGQQLAVQQLINNKIADKNREWSERGYPVAISSGIIYVSAETKDLDGAFIKADKKMYGNKLVNRGKRNA